MRNMIEHHLGMRVDGQIGRFANGGMTAEEFAELTEWGLPSGWVAWHAGTANGDALRKVPLVTDEHGRDVRRDWIVAQLREHAEAVEAIAAEDPRYSGGHVSMCGCTRPGGCAYCREEDPADVLERWPESHDYAYTEAERFGME